MEASKEQTFLKLLLTTATSQAMEATVTLASMVAEGDPPALC